MNDLASLTSVALLWIAMIPALFGSFARRRNWHEIAHFCDGLSWGFALSGLALLLLSIWFKREAGH